MSRCFSVHLYVRKYVQALNLSIYYSKKLIKRSDNASVLIGHATIQCEKRFSDSLGIKLLIRDYSEVQCGKSICDRLSGSAKLRMRAYINSRNDVTNAFDIKRGIIKCCIEF